jgi:hypothetical protein
MTDRAEDHRTFIGKPNGKIWIPCPNCGDDNSYRSDVLNRSMKCFSCNNWFELRVEDDEKKLVATLPPARPRKKKHWRKKPWR